MSDSQQVYLYEEGWGAFTELQEGDMIRADRHYLPGTVRRMDRATADRIIEAGKAWQEVMKLWEEQPRARVEMRPHIVIEQRERSGDQ